jgi:hypothetical protein
VSTNEDTALEIVLTGFDPDCNSVLTYTVVSSPIHGILNGVAPNLTYTPTAGYYGADAFTFVVNDGLATSAPAAVNITVVAVNSAPVADPQSVSTAEDTALAIVLTGSDPDNDPLTYDVVSGPSHGILSGTAPNLTYTPAVNYYGADAFAFVANDGLAVSEPAMVDITVLAIEDAPVANSQSVSTAEDTALAIILTGSDPDGDPVIYSVVSSPSHGILSGAAPTLTYTPTANYNGDDAFTFVVSDGLAVSEPAVVDITVLAVNDAPVANPQMVTTAQGNTVVITLTASDIEEDELTYRIVAGPVHGTLIGTAPHLSYQPAPHFSGFDLFTFVVNDGELDSEPAMVSITIRAIIYLPLVVKP